MEDEGHRHEGSFATGTEKTEHHPEHEDEKGHFADETGHVHEGTFAEGQAETEHHPEREASGRFGGRETPEGEE
jgi:hypothetical protein